MLFVAAMFLIIARFLSVWSGTPFPINLVTSDSMYPSLWEGDVVAWTPTKIEDIQIGDVIVFKSYVHWPDEKIVVHRVSNITHSNKGDILLETKGDANTYTDQAGPHIPEPYIREENLMGKVISIGQQPLKIPFIGLIGIWINNGLDLLSQPTASKESINYLGVFAPLTISAVILVLLIFILPEKAKTIKEKLRLYILGSKPLNLKKTITAFLAAYILFLLIIHLFAYDSVTASVGINTHSEEATMNFGRIPPGKKSFIRTLPVINPGVMPVKGIIFGKGEINKFVTKEIFVLDKGEIQYPELRAIAPNNSKNGTYTGDIMVYSSPFWLIFPDDFIETLYNWNAETTPYLLDILAGIILTSSTLLLLISITFIINSINNLRIDRSWLHPSKLILKKDTIKKLSIFKQKLKKSFQKNILWILNIYLFSEDEEEKIIIAIKKPIIASLIVIPIVFLLSDQILAMIITTILAGVIAYFISCKNRKKIVLTTLLVATSATIYMLAQSNLTILGKNMPFLETLTLAIGAIGIYLLIFTIFIIPLTLISLKIVIYFRNVKEQKDPLLSLERTCDL